MRSLMRRATTFILAMSSAIAGCASHDAESPDCSGFHVDALKELVIVDEGVLADPRASNELDGPWSFRRRIEDLAAGQGEPSTLVSEWLHEWGTRVDVNGYSLDQERDARAKEMDRLLLCPWLRRSPGNTCNEDCSVCAAKQFDLAKAPFRLIGVANRADLGGRPGVDSSLGEGRLIYALTLGPGDDPEAVPAAMTAIFEYDVPATTSKREWSRSWHALGSEPDYGEAFRVKLDALIDRFSARGAWPGRPGGSSIAHVRTNEAAFNWIWQAREWHLEGDGRLHAAPLMNTPSVTLNDSASLRDFVNGNPQDIVADRHVMPRWMLAGSVDEQLFSWKISGVEEPLRRAFAQTTCNGCHVSERPSVDTAFHVSPFRKGAAKLSPFLYSPGNPGGDEVTRRRNGMQRDICGAD
jgi:hypothetical protein